MKKVLSLVLLMAPVLVWAQGFRYDTIPAGNAKAPATSSGFYYETPSGERVQPATQQSTNQTVAIRNRQKQDSAQPSSLSKGFDRSKLVIGGGFGFGFSNDYSSITFSPQVGYEFTRYFTAGAGLSYAYYHWDGYYTQTQHYLGANVYMRFSPIPYIHIQAQPEIYSMWGSANGEALQSKIVPTCLVGGGATIPTGGRGGMTAMFYYDVIQNPNSPYGNRLVYSVGYTYRF